MPYIQSVKAPVVQRAQEAQATTESACDHKVLRCYPLYVCLIWYVCLLCMSTGSPGHYGECVWSYGAKISHPFIHRSNTLVVRWVIHSSILLIPCVRGATTELQRIISSVRMYALYVCLLCMPYMYALYVCLLCMPYMYACYVCLICMPYMYALYVCLICMPAMPSMRTKRVLSSVGFS